MAAFVLFVLVGVGILFQFSLSGEVKERIVTDCDEESTRIGDMRFSIALKNTIKNGIINETFRWPDATLFYYIDPAFNDSEQQAIFEGFEEIQSKTCIRFLPWNNSQHDYLNISNGQSDSGCFSYVGRIGGEQLLNLESGCVIKGVVEHELMHAIGFYHEHSRPERDDYVIINYSNIQEADYDEFCKLNASQVDAFGISYDYNSIMHYDAFDLAINSTIQTIYPITLGVEKLGNTILSPKDAMKVNKMYSKYVQCQGSSASIIINQLFYTGLTILFYTFITSN